MTESAMCDGNVMYGGQSIRLGVLFKNNFGIFSVTCLHTLTRLTIYLSLELFGPFCKVIFQLKSVTERSGKTDKGSFT